ncbi:MAG TPA: hypothetical protein VFP48_08025, partial [Steroidobacteraceae bacterium]|nr:hypothetical protein [Steroidobacteraceae bacterium]
MKFVHAVSLLAVLAAAPVFAADTPAAQPGATSHAQGRDTALVAAVNGDWRTAEVKARDRYRHPAEALEFWG